MKSKWIRILSAALLLSMSVGSLASCGKSGDDEKTDTVSTETTAEEETADIIQDALNRVGEVDYGGQDFTVYLCDLGGYGEEIMGYSDPKQAVGSAIINDAVYVRNAMLEERCHLTFKWVQKGPFEVVSLVKNEVTAPTGDIQFVDNTADVSGGMAAQGILYNMVNFGMDYSEPWWDQGTAAFKLNNSIYFMSGAHNIVDDCLTYMVSFNKKLVRDYKLEDPYIAVENGSWTLPHFLEITANLSAEDGDGTWNENDMYGFAATHVIGSSFMYGAQMKFVDFDPETGRPVLALDEKGLEKMSDMADKLHTLIHENHTTFFEVAPEKFQIPGQVFMAGHVVFFSETVNHLRVMNENMEEEYGVLPIPKYDEAQKEYSSWVVGSGSTLSIPASIKDPETVGQIFETYAILSHKYISPVFYDTLFSSRVAKDVQSIAVLRQLFSHRIYDMPQYYDLGLRNVFKDAVSSPHGQFMSSYKRASRTFNGKVKQLLKAFDKQQQD